MNETSRSATLASRLVLGTAQMGMPYGINNRSGQPNQTEALEMVWEAWQSGICEFDTGQAYGESEKVLGDIFSKIGICEKVRVFTKLNPALDLKNTFVAEKALESSLKRLRVEKLAGLMLHHENQLDLWPQGLGAWLKKKRAGGVIEAIGVSLYTPSKALEVLEMADIQFVQIPANVLDRRFESEGVFRKAVALKKKVYLRSVFLQGLLATASASIPEKMAFAIPAVEKVQRLARQLELSVAELCFAYVILRWPIAQVVFGAETKEQVLQEIRMFRRTYPSNLIERVESELNEYDSRIVNPNLWPR